MDYGDCSLIHLFLVKVLVLDHVDIYEIPQICARIPPGIICIHVDFSQLLDHLDLVTRIRLGSRGSCRQICGGIIIIVMSICWGCLDRWKRKGVGDFEACGLVHANKETSCYRWKRLRAVLDYLHNHLL